MLGGRGEDYGVDEEHEHWALCFFIYSVCIINPYPSQLPLLHNPSQLVDHFYPILKKEESRFLKIF